MEFSDIVIGTIGHEGGYIDHPSDPGGETIWGITARTARANGYSGPMRSMSQAQAIEIYRKAYWQKPRLDQVGEISMPIAAVMFDTGVNMGPSVAVEYMQRLLNTMNRRGVAWAELQTDGLIGPATLTALRKCLSSDRDAEAILIDKLLSLRDARYVEIMEGRPASEDFARGWFRRTLALRRQYGAAA